MDAYYFGGVVSWLCYGRDTHPTWELKTKKPFVALHYHCHDLVRELGEPAAPGSRRKAPHPRHAWPRVLRRGQ